MKNTYTLIKRTDAKGWNYFTVYDSDNNALFTPQGHTDRTELRTKRDYVTAILRQGPDESVSIFGYSSKLNPGKGDQRYYTTSTFFNIHLDQSEYQAPDLEAPAQDLDPVVVYAWDQSKADKCGGFTLVLVSDVVTGRPAPGYTCRNTGIVHRDPRKLRKVVKVLGLEHWQICLNDLENTICIQPESLERIDESKSVLKAEFINEQIRKATAINQLPESVPMEGVCSHLEWRRTQAKYDPKVSRETTGGHWKLCPVGSPADHAGLFWELYITGTGSIQAKYLARGFDFHVYTGKTRKWSQDPTPENIALCKEVIQRIRASHSALMEASQEA